MGTTLDVGIGLISVYLLFSVLCSAVSEAVAGILRLRAVNLAYSIDKLLEDPALNYAFRPASASEASSARGIIEQVTARLPEMLKRRPHPSPLALALRRHPLMKALKHGWVGPSYIPAHTFVAALLDTLRRTDWSRASDHGSPPAEAERPAPGCERDPLDQARRVIAGLPEGSELRRALDTLIDDTVKDRREANARIERWFNDAMDRAAGRYKRWSQMIITAAALVLCVGFNADSLRLANALSHDAVARTRAIAVAQEMAKAPPGVGAPAPGAAGAAAAALAQGGAAGAQLEALELNIAWGKIQKHVDPNPPALWWVIERVLGVEWGRWLRGVVARTLSPGVLITAAAAALGAPFWFDLLNKLVNLRAGGKPPDAAGQ